MDPNTIVSIAKREKLRALASRLDLPHKEIPYPVPPEMLEDMKRWDEMMLPAAYPL